MTMSKETIKISEDVKERMDDLKGEFKYAEPSYSGICEYLLDNYDGDIDGGEELPDGNSSDTSGGSDITRTMNGGDDTSSEDESFQTEGLTAEERANQFKVD